MIEIALDDTETGVLQKDISEKQKISLKYLDSIIASLKTAGLIENIRGKKSGYRLTKPAAQIKMLDIYKAFEPPIVIVDCVKQNHVCELDSHCGVKTFWGDLNATIINHFESHTLADLVKEHHLKSQN